MKDLPKKQKILIGIIIAFVFIASISFTYAYFSIGIAEQNPNDQVVTTGTLELTYTDGPEISMNRAFPGDTITKTFKVENTGTLDVFYKVDWKSYENEILNEELRLSLTCTSYEEYYKEDDERNVIGGTCDSLLDNPLYITESPNALLENIYILPGYTHIYEFSLTFIETSSVQNYNQGKLFNGEIYILQSSEAVSLRGILLTSTNEPISGATVVVHSREARGVTDENGIYEIRKVEVGEHTIEVYDGETLIATDRIEVTTSRNGTVENKKINWRNNSNTDYLKINLNISSS